MRPAPTGREIRFGINELIVSKTDLKGRITYANDVFERVSGFSASELIGQPHNVIRHPGMPRSVFQLLWDTIGAGEEVFAYVVNLARNGDEYWVLAHVTPSYDTNGAPCGYHSNRRLPHDDAIAKVKPLYAALVAEERRHADKREAVRAGQALLNRQLAQAGVDYSQFVFSLSRHTTLDEVAA
ncbi:MAG: PAS domain-containing protein [Acidobacteria bacterium]|nr:PAS domain-containing protein [Acidobacteriota bacterium]